jgi:hypothetical protein
LGKNSNLNSPDIEAAIKAIKKECTSGLLPQEGKRNSNLGIADTVQQA